MPDEVDEIVAAWRRERPDLDVAPLQVLSRVSRLADVLDERRADAFVEHGLQAHEFDVLAALRRSGEPFELTAGELGALTHVTSGTMTSRLDRLSPAQSRLPAPRPRRRAAGAGPPDRRRPPARGRGVRRHCCATERELLATLPAAARQELADGAANAAARGRPGLTRHRRATDAGRRNVRRTLR